MPAASSSFLDNFWPALAAGLISGLFTVIVAGLIVWQVQSRSERSRARKLALRELVTLQDQVRAAIVERKAPVYSSAVQSLPSEWSTTASLLTGQPFGSWIDLLPGQRPILANFQKMSTSYATLVKKARDLDDALLESMMIIKSSVSVYPLILPFFLALGDRGIKHRELAAATVGAPQNVLGDLTKYRNILYNDADVQSVYRAYVKASEPVSDVFSEIRNALTSDIPYSTTYSL